MQKKKNTRSAQIHNQSRVRAADIIVYLLCAIGIFLCLYLFYRDLNTSLLRQGEEPVASISFKYKAAQRRVVDRVMWDRLKQNSPVYEGDLIRTADLSEATVHFPNNSEITLDENSIIQIFAGRVDFSEGGLNFSSADSNSGIIISSGGKTLAVSAGSVVNLKTNSEGAVNLLVYEGSTLIDSGDGVTEAAAGSAVFLDQTGEPVLQSVAIPLTPYPQVKYLTQELANVHFSWNAVDYAPGETTRLEIAEDRNFTRVFASYDVASAQETVPLSQGVWYWRVYPSKQSAQSVETAQESTEDSSASNASAAKLSVVISRPPALIAPTQAASFAYRSKLPEVRLAWTESAEAIGYVVEVSQDASFISPRIRTQTGGTSFLCVNLGEGTWYWRVRPVFSGNYAGSVDGSQTAAFVISKKTGLEAPALTFPADGAFFNVGSERQNSYFAWKRDTEAASYTINISRNRDLSAPVLTRTVQENFFTYGAAESILGEGVYYWGVTLSDAEGVTASSGAFSFTSHKEEITQRTVFPPEGYAIAENLLIETRFTWRTNIPAWMRFQVSSSRDFSTLLIDDLTSSESAMGKKLPIGTYYWRIAADTSSSRASSAALSKFVTEPKIFTVMGQFEKPQPQSPLENTRVLPVNDAEFRWTALEEAEGYLFRLYNERNALMFERDISDPAVTVNMSRYEPGNYSWTVQAMAGATPARTKRMGQQLRTAFYVALPNRVKLSEPLSESEFKFTTTEARGTVRWESDEQVDSSRFVLSDNPNPLTGTPLMSVANPPREIQLIALEQGTYYWTVTALSHGFDVSAEKPFSFTIAPIDPLPPPGGINPQRAVFGAEDIMEMQNMVFRWNPVEGANAYVFILEQQRANGTREIVRTQPRRQTTYTAELNILDVGSFVWRVEAVRLGASGRVERRGLYAQGAFTINIQLPQEIELYDVGTLYGN